MTSLALGEPLYKIRAIFSYLGITQAINESAREIAVPARCWRVLPMVTISAALHVANAAAALTTTGFGAVAPLPNRATVSAYLKNMLPAQ